MQINIMIKVKRIYTENMHIVSEEPHNYGRLPFVFLHKDHQIDITCFSFGPVKNFGAIGGAGAITGSKEICDEARQIKNHGRKIGRKKQRSRYGKNV